MSRVLGTVVAVALSGIFVASVSRAQDVSTGAQSQPVETGAAAPSSQPQSAASPFPARLSDVEGSVSILQSGPPASSDDARTETPSGEPGAPGMPPSPPADPLFSQAIQNMPVTAGMEIRTGDGGRAEIQFADGSIARVAPNSDLAVISLTPDGEVLAPRGGLSYFETVGGAQPAFVVNIAGEQMQPETNTLVRVDLDATPYLVAVLAGGTHFSVAPGAVKNGLNFDAAAGESVSLDPTGNSQPDVREQIASNSWDAWNSDRDQLLAQMAENQTSARDMNGDGDPEAWNDLDYYGTWYDVPGVGPAWGPDGVDADFDPYGSGAWGFYPGVGATWISAYPWGWLPYRCGGWGFYSGFGWMWRPDGCGIGRGTGWYPYTGVHNAPRGYTLPAFGFGGRTRLRGAFGPKPIPLHTVNRGANYQFRAAGGARPTPRAFGLAGDSAEGAPGATASTLPLFRSGQLRGENSVAEPGALHGAIAEPGHGRAGYVPAAPVGGLRSAAPGAPPVSVPRIVAPPVRVAPAPVRVYTPPPVYSAPRMAAPSGGRR